MKLTWPKWLKLSLQKTVLLVLLAAALVPIMLLVTLYNARLGSAAREHSFDILEAKRADFSRQLEVHFQAIEAAVTQYTSNGDEAVLRGTLNALSSWESLSFYDGSYAYESAWTPRGSLAESDVPAEIRRNLQAEIFSGNLAYRFMIFDNSSSQFALFVRFGEEANGGYAAIHFSSDVFRRFLPSGGNEEYLLMNRYYVALNDSNLARIESVVPINDLTQRMADGYTEQIVYQGMDRVITTISLYPDSLFLSVSGNRGDYSQPALSISLLILISLLLAAAAVGAWYVNRLIVAFGEDILISDRYTADMRFFKRLLSTIDRIRKEIPAVQASMQDIQFLYNDLDVLESRSPHAKKVRDDVDQAAKDE